MGVDAAIKVTRLPSLLRPEAADVRRHYYNPYRQDGQFGTPATATAAALRQIPALAQADDNPPVADHSIKIRRRTVIIAIAGPSGAALLAVRPALDPPAKSVHGPSAKSVHGHPVTSGSGAPIPARKPLWKFATGAAINCTARVADGILYIGNNAGHVYVLHVAHGKRRWKHAAVVRGEIDSRPAVIGKVLYVASSRSGLYALDTRIGPPSVGLSCGRRGGIGPYC